MRRDERPFFRGGELEAAEEEALLRLRLKIAEGLAVWKSAENAGEGKIKKIIGAELFDTVLNLLERASFVNPRHQGDSLNFVVGGVGIRWGDDGVVTLGDSGISIRPPERITENFRLLEVRINQPRNISVTGEEHSGIITHVAYDIHSLTGNPNRYGLIYEETRFRGRFPVGNQ